MKLTEIIISSAHYLSEFNYDRYPKNFTTFSKRCLQVLSEDPIQNASSAAGNLIEDFDSLCASSARRERKKTAFEFKQVLALFLSPFCLKEGGEFEMFAVELNRLWNLKYPKNVYYVSDYDSIMEGFDINLLGLPLRKYNKYAK